MTAPIDLNPVHRNEVQGKIPLPVDKGTAENFAMQMEGRNFQQLTDQNKQLARSDARIAQQNENVNKQNIQQHQQHHKHKQQNLNTNRQQSMNMQGDVHLEHHQHNHQKAVNERGKEGHQRAVHHKGQKSQTKENNSHTQLRKTAKNLTKAKLTTVEGETDFEDSEKQMGSESGGKDSDSGSSNSGGSEGGKDNKNKNAKKEESSLSQTIKDKANSKSTHVTHNGKKLAIKKSKTRIDRVKQSFENILFEEDVLSEEIKKNNKQNNIERILKEKRKKKKRKKKKSNNEMVTSLMKGLVSRAIVLHEEGGESCEMQMHLSGPLIDNTKLIIKQLNKQEIEVLIYASNYSAYVYFQRHLKRLEENLKEGKHKKVVVRLLFVKEIPVLEEDAEVLDLTELSNNEVETKQMKHSK